MDNVTLQEFAGGGLQENFQKAFEDVVKNMQDPNTPWKNKRSITIKLAFNQNEDRDDSSCEITVEKKLAPVKPIETKFALGKDLKTGEVYAEEYGKQIKGQMSIADVETSKPENVVDLRTKKA
jgi:hypothetical protein